MTLNSIYNLNHCVIYGVSYSFFELLYFSKSILKAWIISEEVLKSISGFHVEYAN